LGDPLAPGCIKKRSYAMRLQILIVAVLWAAFSGSLSFGTDTTSLPALSVEELRALTDEQRVEWALAALRWRDEQLQNFTLVHDWKSIHVAADGKVFATFQHVEVLRRLGEQYHMTLTFPPDDHGESPKREQHWDGSVLRGRQLVPSTQWVTLNDKEEDWLFVTPYWKLLGFQGYFWMRWMDLADFVEELHEKGKERPDVSQVTTEMVEGTEPRLRLTIKYGGTRYVILMLDPARQYMPARVSVAGTTSTGSVKEEWATEVTESQEVGGLWVPTRARATMPGRPDGGAEHYEISVSNFQRNVVRLEDLEIPIRPGNRVMDYAHKVAYVVEADGSTTFIEIYDPDLGVVTKGGVAVGPSIQPIDLEPVASTQATANTPPQGLWGFVPLAVVGFAIAAVCAAIWYRLRPS
jgi:hypothetical protein